MEEFISTTEAGKLLKITRHAVRKRIANGTIKAKKFGRDYLIPRDEVRKALGEIIGEESKGEINKAIKKAVREYRGAFKKLGRE